MLERARERARWGAEKDGTGKGQNRRDAQDAQELEEV